MSQPELIICLLNVLVVAAAAVAVLFLSQHLMLAVVAEVVVEGGKAAEGANEKPCKEAEGVGDVVTLGGVG